MEDLKRSIQGGSVLAALQTANQVAFNSPKVCAS